MSAIHTSYVSLVEPHRRVTRIALPISWGMPTISLCRPKLTSSAFSGWNDSAPEGSFDHYTKQRYTNGYVTIDIGRRDEES